MGRFDRNRLERTRTTGETHAQHTTRDTQSERLTGEYRARSKSKTLAVGERAARVPPHGRRRQRTAATAALATYSSCGKPRSVPGRQSAAHAHSVFLAVRRGPVSARFCSSQSRPSRAAPGSPLRRSRDDRPRLCRRYALRYDRRSEPSDRCAEIHDDAHPPRPPSPSNRRSTIRAIHNTIIYYR